MSSTHGRWIFIELLHKRVSWIKQGCVQTWKQVLCKIERGRLNRIWFMQDWNTILCRHWAYLLNTVNSMQKCTEHSHIYDTTDSELIYLFTMLFKPGRHIMFQTGNIQYSFNLGGSYSTLWPCHNRSLSIQRWSDKKIFGVLVVFINENVESSHKLYQNPSNVDHNKYIWNLLNLVATFNIFNN